MAHLVRLFLPTLQGSKLTNGYRAVLTVMVVFVLLRGISKRREGVNSPMVEV